MLLITLLLTGCASPAYYWQAARGQWQISHGGTEVASLLANPSTDPALRQQLLHSQQVLAFADQHLGLPVGDAYQRYLATGRDAVTWTVIATPEFSLEPKRWCHLLAGCVAYRGYFDEDAARSFAEKLKRRALDVAVFPVPAYSTLGYLDDPLLDTMLFDDDVRTAALLIHELAHRQLYLPGDAAFSEAYAGFVEQQGVSEWLAAAGPAGASDAKDRWHRYRVRMALGQEILAAAQADLHALYQQEISVQAMRQRKTQRLHDLVRQLESEAPPASAWVGTNPNNAHLALAGIYRPKGCPFKTLFNRAGGDWMKFHEQARQIAKLTDEERKQWLEAPCANLQDDRIAPHGNL